LCTTNIFVTKTNSQILAQAINPDFPLDPSSSRRRGSSKKNTPRSGQNLDFDLLCREFLINWIPACAGMTKFRANGKSRIKLHRFYSS
jgi:hypothetical protein